MYASEASPSAANSTADSISATTNRFQLHNLTFKRNAGVRRALDTDRLGSQKPIQVRLIDRSESSRESFVTRTDHVARAALSEMGASQPDPHELTTDSGSKYQAPTTRDAADFHRYCAFAAAIVLFIFSSPIRATSRASCCQYFGLKSSRDTTP